MRKMILILSLILLTAALVSAENINLGKFPLGEWTDTNYKAQWIFATDNIQLKQGDKLVFDFKDKVKDFDVNASLTGIEMTFRCDETGRKYKFSNDLKSTDIKMIIDKDSGIHYEVGMKRK